MPASRIRKLKPRWPNVGLALVSALLLVLAFPDFEIWWLAWIALVPLLWALEGEKASTSRSFVLGWLFGTAFFFGTCWWLAYAPIHYAGFWPVLAYSLILIACLGAGIFPGIFAAIMAVLLRRFGSRVFVVAPFVWVFSEFARYWLTGNDWNAIGYSQYRESSVMVYAPMGGLLAVSFAVVVYNLVARSIFLIVSAVAVAVVHRVRYGKSPESPERTVERPMFALINDDPDEQSNAIFIGGLLVFILFMMYFSPRYPLEGTSGVVVTIQPNVPMSGLNYLQVEQLRERQFALAQSEIAKLSVPNRKLPILVVLPESPMNFMYNDDREFQQFVRDFTTRNNVSLLFNSAEPDKTNGKYFNSAVMVGPDGNEVAEYDKIYLLPFGEAVPVPLDSVLPGFVGNFSYGRNYQLLPVGDAKAGVMICFESHFGQLSRRYVQDGADMIIEMTNDGYLGPTPVLRQHLANAVFRAVETNRPVLRVTNVGITAYINERGEVLDPLPPYSEGTRVWSVSKSDGSQTFYVRYGDWFAWVCSAVTIWLLIVSIRRRREVAEARALARA